MFVLPGYIRVLDRLHAVINFEILWVFICLIIGLVLVDLYRFVFKKHKRNKVMIIRITVYVFLLLMIRWFYYIQFEKTFKLDLTALEAVTIDAKNDEGRVIAEALQLEADFIEIVQNLEFTLAKVEKKSYTTSDELIEIRIIPKAMRYKNLYMVLDADEVLTVYIIGGASLTLQSDHKPVFDYISSGHHK